MCMKIFFIILLALFCSFSLLAQSSGTEKPTALPSKAVLSYELPTQLDWEQSTDSPFNKEMKVFTLGDSKNIRMSSMQAGNEKLWSQFASMDKEKIYKELVSGKKIIHDMMGYKNWKAEKSLQKKSEKEIIFEISGNYIDNLVKKYFIEKYYVTPYGFILISLDWTDKSEKKLTQKAQSEFKTISFKSEIL